ncbi:MAG TPA: GGDEF domain-containing protein [Candidatus Saccharimonadales bacterium]|nr:GGDEF domain-containing protein [Candidatus Saccharimonadales bacterium]
MNEVFPPDPRLLPVEVVGFDVPAEKELPCGQQTCSPLEGDCCETGSNRDQAVLSCARFLAAGALAVERDELLVELETHKQLIHSLSVDRKTGILTLNANEALFNRLGQTGLLERMHDEGYVMQLTFGDLDKLKEHNTLGDHEGGDAVIASAAQTLRKLYRRNYDVVGVLEYEEEIRQALARSEPFSTVSRFDAGDELIVMSFLPPVDELQGRDRTSTDRLQNEVRRITEAFDGLTVEYRLKRGVDVAATHQRLAEEGFVFKLGSGGLVQAPVSMTFATVLANVPRNQDEFEAIKRSADATMMVAKRLRSSVRTRGTFAYLLDDGDEA